MQTVRGMENKARPVYVHRDGEWLFVESSELVPGDVVSLIRVKSAKAVTEAATTTTASTTVDATVGSNRIRKKRTKVEPVASAAPATPPATPNVALDDATPCDVLVLQGSAVVNEAALTGESVPQV